MKLALLQSILSVAKRKKSLFFYFLFFWGGLFRNYLDKLEDLSGTVNWDNRPSRQRAHRSWRADSTWWLEIGTRCDVRLSNVSLLDHPFLMNFHEATSGSARIRLSFLTPNNTRSSQGLQLHHFSVWLPSIQCQAFCIFGLLWPGAWGRVNFKRNRRNLVYKRCNKQLHEPYPGGSTKTSSQLKSPRWLPTVEEPGKRKSSYLPGKGRGKYLVSAISLSAQYMAVWLGASPSERAWGPATRMCSPCLTCEPSMAPSVVWAVLSCGLIKCQYFWQCHFLNNTLTE